MKAANLIRHLGMSRTKPLVRIKRQGIVLLEAQTCGLDTLEDIETYCRNFDLKVTTFIVKDNTLTINVV